MEGRERSRVQSVSITKSMNCGCASISFSPFLLLGKHVARTSISLLSASLSSSHPHPHHHHHHGEFLKYFSAMFAYRLGEFCARALYEFLAEFPAHFYTISSLLPPSLFPPSPPLCLSFCRFIGLLDDFLSYLRRRGGAGGVVYCYFDQSNTVVNSNSNEMQVGALFDWICRHCQWAWLNFKLAKY